jgi:hypothetical protein
LLAFPPVDEERPGEGISGLALRARQQTEKRTMSCRTVIEKGSNGDILVILPSGAVSFATDARDAVHQIKRWEKRAARHGGFVVNEREWRGFAQHEVEGVQKQDALA